MISLDFKNVYPSINLKKMKSVINNAIKIHYTEPKINTNLRSLTNLILNEIYF